MKNPVMFGRPMKLIKKYKSFALYMDEKTGIKQSFLYHDLKQNYDSRKEDEEIVPIKKIIKSDTRLSQIIDKSIEYELFDRKKGE